jgi:signal transduction histidine kinase
MDSSVRLRGPGRERLALAIGLASAALLAGAAFAPFTDPDLAGRAALAQVAGRVADGVVDEWNRILEEPEAHAAAVGDSFTWRESDRGQMGRAAQKELAPAVDAPANAFDTLLRESEREEVAEPDAALALVLEAFDKKPDPGQRAEGRLRAIRLSVRAGKPETAREQLDLALSELDGAEARQGVSYLLLAGLAAAPALEETKCATVAKLLVERWTSKVLALPARSATVDLGSGLRAELDPMTEALRARLFEIAPEPELRRDLEQDLEREKAWRLGSYLGSLPQRPEDDAPSSSVVGANLLVWRRAPPDATRLVAIPIASLEAALRASLAQHALLPDGFAVDFAGEDSAAGPVVRERTPLGREPNAHGFLLRHTDPDSFVRLSTRRLWTVRGGLLLLAGFALAGGLATWRAMRRERHLAWMRTAFVANVSHELRTPLASILLMAENLEAGRVPESAQARYHASIRREAGRLRRLVDDVLDFSRVERGKDLDVRIEDTALEDWIAALRADVLDWAQRSSIDLAISVRDLPGSAAIDPEALRRAVFNLLDNARLHSGSQEIAFAARGQDGSLVLSVADRGRGIPRARRREIFEPFARIESGADGAPGTGLGLAIVREIARAHGGLVRLADPQEGPGSVFEIEIPARAAEEARA